MRKFPWKHWGSAKFQHQMKKKKKMADSRCAFSNQNIVEKLEENAKNKNTLKVIQTWLNVWQTWATERKVNQKLKNTSTNNSKKKSRRLSNFVEYTINKKSYALARAFRDL